MEGEREKIISIHDNMSEVEKQTGTWILVYLLLLS